MSTGAGKNLAALTLYRTILRLHRQKLPSNLREMGDSYVKYVSSHPNGPLPCAGLRKEFRDHKNAKPEFVAQFMEAWTDYAQSMQGPQAAEEPGSFGRDLAAAELEAMNEEQRLSLERLKQEATNFSRTPGLN
ncbi:Succinate dehydrogenase assembly factor 3, partial [Durusdinium trenchii]